MLGAVEWETLVDYTQEGTRRNRSHVGGASILLVVDIMVDYSCSYEVKGWILRKANIEKETVSCC